jgi:2',3'-cyclic-nucleotide 2'-phosphodiesterase (5'-nucleotidase family)
LIVFTLFLFSDPKTDEKTCLSSADFRIPGGSHMFQRQHLNRSGLFFLGSLVFFLSGSFSFAEQESISLSIFHTNDLHSHFRPQRDVLNLGGVARMKTKVDQLRKMHPNSLLLDGGDWSEGNVYYNLDAGQATVKMLSHIGYDAMVVGNHDWINGPGILIDAIDARTNEIAFLAANLDVSKYPRANEFSERVLPYVIREMNGARVALIGVATFEFVYDRYFDPIEITPPQIALREAVREIGDQADVFIALSHNRLAINQALLRKVPEIDLIVSGHQHALLLEPLVVEQADGRSSWVVEVGAWGKYLGQVDLQFNGQGAVERGLKKVDLLNYKVHAIDASIPEDLRANQMIDQLEFHLENMYGPIFSDHVTHSHIDLDRAGPESYQGNLTTDAYRHTSGADLALDHFRFIYGGLHRGDIRSVDVLNSNPGVYSAETQRMWTLKTFDIKGSTLNWMLNFLLSPRQLGDGQILSASGLEVIYDSPFIAKAFLGFDLFSFLNPFRSVIQSIKIGGRTLRLDQNYQVAASGGLIETIGFINSILPNFLEISNLQETGTESWQVARDYLKQFPELTKDRVTIGDRFRTLGPDVAVLKNEIEWTPFYSTEGGFVADIKARIFNHGASPLTGREISLKIQGNLNAPDTTIPPEWVEIGKRFSLPRLGPGDSREFHWSKVEIPGDRGLFQVRVAVDGAQDENNISNNGAVVWFKK